MKKKYLSYIVLSALVVSLIIVLALSFYRRGGTGPAKSTADGDELERLFHEVGIVKISRVPDPLEISLKDLDGRPVRISDFRGNIVFLNFWTTWCPSCREEMPAIERLHKRLKGKNFVIVGINLHESASQVREFFKAYNLTFMTLLDTRGEVGASFGIRSIPTTLVLNKKGRLIGAALGSRKWDGEKAIALFEHLIEKD